MRIPRIAVALFAVALASYAYADPATAISEARQLMQQNKFDAAIQKLQDAIPDATTLGSAVVSDRNMQVVSANPIAKGVVERWIFAKEQLPRTVPDMEIVFKFITEEGYGDHILQRDFLVNKALHDAAQQ